LEGIVLVGLVFLVWYLIPLASAEGVTTIFLMLLAIHVILGLLLSLQVYKEGKKLRIDLSIIVLIQVTVSLWYLCDCTVAPSVDCTSRLVI